MMSKPPINIYNLRELTSEELAIIKATVPALEQAGETLTQKFYQHMLNDFPEVRDFFNDSDQRLMKQPRALAFALLSYAKNIENLAPLDTFVHQIVVKHVGLQVKAQHYPIVGGCLLDTMKELFGPKVANEQFLAAWAAAYGNLAQLLINAEDEEYQKNPWDGFREFEVTKIIPEADNVKSVYFAPTDGGEIHKPQRGQYVCIRWTIPGFNFLKSREYSLSMFPFAKEYRISVRLLDGGLVSSHIHNELKVGDKIPVAPPCGQLVYRDSPKEKDLVAFVGGIGITPLVSIIEYALENGRNVTLFFSNKSAKSRPFAGWLTELKQQYIDQFKLKEYFSDNKCANVAIDEAVDRSLQDNDFDHVTPELGADIYLLGPRGYMTAVKNALIVNEINPEDILSEYFGPLEV